MYAACKTHLPLVTHVFGSEATADDIERFHDEVVFCPDCQAELEVDAGLPKGHFANGGFLADPIFRQRLGLPPRLSASDAPSPAAPRRPVTDRFASTMSIPTHRKSGKK